LVILAHGFGGTHAARLWAYAERFAAGGASALVFDYRHFGESAGEPRQLLSVRRQLEDWRAALAFGRSLAGVDPSRVALWGTSFGGGHVVRLAAGEPRVAAVISQAPLASGPNVFERTIADQIDFLRRQLGIGAVDRTASAPPA
jgi:pimeloyl-ACP methyl ester carboxylesterase